MALAPTSANDVHFQAYLLEGLSRWNQDREHQQHHLQNLGPGLTVPYCVVRSTSLAKVSLTERYCPVLMNQGNTQVHFVLLKCCKHFYIVWIVTVFE